MPTRSPRLNVSISDEQHGLLLELSALQQRSASSYLREMLDAVTPLLRSTVPALRAAAQEMELTRAEARDALKEPLDHLRQLGILGAADLFDGQPKKRRRAAAPARSASDVGRGKRRPSSNG